MARLLALEWDSREVRVVVGQKRRGAFVLEQAFAIELRGGASGDAIGTDANPGKLLAAALAERKIERGEALVAVGRGNIEVRPLTLPPAPADEQPDLVRFQALKQFTTLGEDWPLDFAPFQREGTDQLSVLAAAISPELVAQIRATCVAAELVPTRVVLRPFAAAALLRRRRTSAECVLVVDLLADEADLTIVDAGSVSLIRTTRLPGAGEPDEHAKFMTGEIRRTIAAASNQLGRKVERVVICGDAQDHGVLRAQLAQLPGVTVELFDPFEGVELADDAQAVRPQHVGRYAPLLGMVTCEASGAAHDIDFLNPRRRPPPPNRRRRNTLIGAGVGVATLLVGGYYWIGYAELDGRVNSLNKDVAALKEDLKKLEPTVARATNVDDFEAGAITWLDELSRLSEKFLPPEDAIMGQLSMSPAPRGATGGVMTLDGHVRSSSHLVQLETQLRDEQHRASLGNGRFDDKKKVLPWKFDGSVAVGATTEEPAKATPRPAARTGSAAR